MVHLNTPPLLSSMKNLTEAQKGWLAGFIDGEGYLGITFQRKKETRLQAASPLLHPYLVVVNTNREVLQHIRELIGDGHVYISKKGSDRMKESYQYKLTKMAVLLDVLKALEYYFRIKSRQCRILIEFIRRRMSTKRKTGRGSRGVTSFTTLDFSSHRALLVLNKRGPSHYAPLPR